MRSASFSLSVLVLALASVAGAQSTGGLPATGPADAGARFFGGIVVGATSLGAPSSRFDEPAARLRGVVAGVRVAHGLGLEARVVRFADRVTDRTIGNYPDAPLTVGLRATVVEAGVGYRPSALAIAGVVQPVVRVGGAWMRIADTWESDTPEEERPATALGASVGAALELSLGRHLAVSAGTSYRRMKEPGGRPPQSLGIDGASWDVGLQFRR
jgi:hypothetical protein